MHNTQFNTRHWIYRALQIMFIPLVPWYYMAGLFDSLKCWGAESTTIKINFFLEAASTFLLIKVVGNDEFGVVILLKLFDWTTPKASKPH